MQTPQRKPAKFAGKKPDPLMTLDKYHRLQKKLDSLRSSLPRAKQEMKLHAQDGDFSENAAYQTAKWRLRGLNSRIETIENHLKMALIIETPENTDKVALGSKVTVEMNGQEKTYRILGSSETDPKNNIISYTSPLGSMLMDKRVGDNIKIKLNNRQVLYKIIKISK